MVISLCPFVSGKVPAVLTNTLFNDNVAWLGFTADGTLMYRALPSGTYVTKFYIHSTAGKSIEQIGEYAVPNWASSNIRGSTDAKATIIGGSPTSGQAGVLVRQPDQTLLNIQTMTYSLYIYYVFSEDGIYLLHPTLIVAPTGISLFKRNAAGQYVLAHTVAVIAGVNVIQNAVGNAAGTYFGVVQVKSASDKYVVGIYRRTGDTLAYTSAVDTGRTGSMTPTMSASGTYIIVQHILAPYVYLYKNNNGIATAITTPSTWPNLRQAQFIWSRLDDNFVFVLVDAGTQTSRILLFARTGDTFTEVPLPEALKFPAVTANMYFGKIVLSPNEEYMFIPMQSGSPVTYYNIVWHWPLASYR